MAESKSDHKTLIAIVTLAVSSMVGGGASLHDAVTPDRLHADDHDRLIRIEEQVVSLNERLDNLKTVQNSHDTEINAHGDRLTAVETKVDYLHILTE